MRLIALVAAVMGAGVCPLGGCNVNNDAPSGGRSEVPPASRGTVLGTWELRSIRGEAMDLAATPRAPTMRIEEGGRVGGFGGVNSWGAEIDADRLDAGEFVMSPQMSTLMAGPPEAMDLEQRFFGALGGARAFRMDTGSLVLTDADGGELLRFERAD